ncbi:MAG: AAA family ATPase [Acholeplasmatales bacterium]|nr:AAA family ATPase [Acholeplasmatales bacterium]
MSKINNLSINSYRVIRNLELKDLGDVNIILGDSNSGKTSVLEAIQFLRSDCFSNVIDIIKSRKASFDSVSFNDFIFLFNTLEKEISISADINGKKEDIRLDYSISETVFNKEMYVNDNNNPTNKLLDSLIDNSKINGKSVPQVKGTLKYDSNEEKYSLVPFDFTIGNYRIDNRVDKRKIIYESPDYHFSSMNLIVSNIIKDDEYYNIFIEVLKLFDDSINKVQLLVNDGVPFEITDIYISRKNEKPMPISSYGDGIKKAICLAGMLLRAKNGILLIDEIETSLHHDYYDEIVYFLVKVCKAYNIQAFITTHNEEVISSFSKYNKENKAKSNIKFYTIRKKENKVVSRMLTPEDVEKYKALGLEVRN